MEIYDTVTEVDNCGNQTDANDGKKCSLQSFALMFKNGYDNLEEKLDAIHMETDDTMCDDANCSNQNDENYIYYGKKFLYYHAFM